MRSAGETFFPLSPNADLEDLAGYNYPQEIEISMEITQDEVKNAIHRSAPDKAPGPDGITNRMLRQLVRQIAPLLTRMFNACVRQGYHPIQFRESITVALRKLNREDYTIAKAYRPIALLNTIGKTLEAVMAEKLTNVTEANRLLPETQMGARHKRSAITALQLLTEQVHTIWGSGQNQVTTVLSMDMAGTFDNVSHARLLH